MSGDAGAAATCGAERHDSGCARRSRCRCAGMLHAVRGVGETCCRDVPSGPGRIAREKLHSASGSGEESVPGSMRWPSWRVSSRNCRARWGMRDRPRERGSVGTGKRSWARKLGTPPRRWRTVWTTTPPRQRFRRSSSRRVAAAWTHRSYWMPTSFSAAPTSSLGRIPNARQILYSCVTVIARSPCSSRAMVFLL